MKSRKNKLYMYLKDCLPPAFRVRSGIWEIDNKETNNTVGIIQNTVSTSRDNLGARVEEIVDIVYYIITDKGTEKMHRIEQELESMIEDIETNTDAGGISYYVVSNSGLNREGIDKYYRSIYTIKMRVSII